MAPFAVFSLLFFGLFSIRVCLFENFCAGPQGSGHDPMTRACHTLKWDSVLRASSSPQIQAMARLMALSMSTAMSMRWRMEVKESLAKLGI